MCLSKMARKDDPVFNVRFVQLVEKQPSLWNQTHPGYSKKEVVQRSWQQVATECKDTVRNCRERWRTIRSSFLRSMKVSGSQSGRGKRKYYLFKYLQFLIPFTKSRDGQMEEAELGSTSCATGTLGRVLRNPSTVMMPQREPPEREIEDIEEEQTKESVSEEEILMDMQMSEMEDKDILSPPTDQAAGASALPFRLQTVKVEQLQSQGNHQSLVTVPVSALGGRMDWADVPPWTKGGSTGAPKVNRTKVYAPGYTCLVDAVPPPGQGSGAGSPMPVSSPDADFSFLISLQPYLKEMDGKQNRRFRQKVIGLIDNVLDNTDI
ncbi:hypothetical protein KR074_005483 [Drosophila pseudoananassae]|nr:hypothetical protein KR074_005483 [Drosophila pseudoananassae]